MNNCYLNGCKQSASLRCSLCKKSYYCSKEHQRSDWNSHKKECNQVKTTESQNEKIECSKLEQVNPSNINNAKSSCSASIKDSKDVQGMEQGKRSCRCMFCGKQLLLESEEAAIEHMRECPSLQEQLSSKDQFTIPSIVRTKMKTQDST